MHDCKVEANYYIATTNMIFWGGKNVYITAIKVTHPIFNTIPAAV